MSDLKRRRAEEKEQRREAIVDAAEQVFGTIGYDTATMEDVARAARVSRALVYLYFKSKPELHFAICVRALRLLRERFVEAAATQARGYDGIIAVGRAYIAFADAHPAYFAALTRFEAHVPEQIEDGSVEHQAFAAGRAVHEVTVSCLLTGMRDGSIRADLENPLLAAMSLWAFTHGLVQLARTKPHFFAQIGVDTAQFAEYAVDFVMRSLQPPPGTR